MRMASPAPSILLSSLKMRPSRSSLGACAAHAVQCVEWWRTERAGKSCATVCEVCVGHLENLGRLESRLILLVVTGREQRDRRDRDGASNIEHKPRA